MLQSENVASDAPYPAWRPPSGPPRGAASDVGGPEGAPFLDTRTNFDGPLKTQGIPYRAKLLTYPTGHAEAVLTVAKAPRLKRDCRFHRPFERIDLETGEVVDRRELSPSEQVAARHKSVSRTRTKIRRACMALGADRMATLTYRKPQFDLAQVWRDFSRFARSMREAQGSFAYVVVAERHKSGAWHLHLALYGYQNLDLWLKHWPHGYRHFRVWKGPSHSMAGYMSKYVTKSFANLNNDAHPHAHRFRRSQGLNPAEYVSLATIDPVEAADLMQSLFKANGLVGFAHVEGGTEGEADFYVWGCTWLEPPDP